MNDKLISSDVFYTKLFTEDPLYSRPFPNLEEARRWTKICEFLSQIVHSKQLSAEPSLRILDVGCGRGWLTNLARVYGSCEGVDPVASSISLARRYFPDLTFYVGTTVDVMKSQYFKPYDVIISSEVIEHVKDKDSFVRGLRDCLAPDGHIILTTPRGEEFKKWTRLGFESQPVEEWITESELRSLFVRYQFVPIANDRIYLNFSKMSFLHRLCASRKLSSMAARLHVTWMHKGLQYLTSIYQVWWFRLNGSDW